MFLVNSSVGSFAAAPTSLDARDSRSQKNIYHVTYLRKNLAKLAFCLVIKKDLFTTIYRSKPLRTHVRSLTSLFNRLLLLSERGSYPPKWGQTLSRSYGRYIAEFLSEGSLVSLSLLDSSTCVGLRYGRL